MLIRYPDGSFVEGTLHRLEGKTARATVGGVDHAVEFTLIQNGWTSTTGVVVTFEFTMGRGPDPSQVKPAGICEGLAGCAAGGDCILRKMPHSGLVH